MTRGEESELALIVYTDLGASVLWTLALVLRLLRSKPTAKAQTQRINPAVYLTVT